MASKSLIQYVEDRNDSFRLLEFKMNISDKIMETIDECCMYKYNRSNSLFSFIVYIYDIESEELVDKLDVGDDVQIEVNGNHLDVLRNDGAFIGKLDYETSDAVLPYVKSGKYNIINSRIDDIYLGRYRKDRKSRVYVSFDLCKPNKTDEFVKDPPRVQNRIFKVSYNNAEELSFSGYSIKIPNGFSYNKSDKNLDFVLWKSNRKNNAADPKGAEIVVFVDTNLLTSFQITGEYDTDRLELFKACEMFGNQNGEYTPYDISTDKEIRILLTKRINSKNFVNMVMLPTNGGIRLVHFMFQRREYKFGAFVNFIEGFLDEMSINNPIYY